jgi:hypothetical protein
MDFSSWPRDQEQTFVVYEERASESQKKATAIGVIAAIGMLVLALGIYAGVEPDRRDVTKDMNMSNLSKKSVKAEPKSESPAPAPAAAAAAAAPAAAPAAPAADKK